MSCAGVEFFFVGGVGVFLSHSSHFGKLTRSIFSKDIGSLFGREHLTISCMKMRERQERYSHVRSDASKR